MTNATAPIAHIKLPFWRQLRWNLTFFFLLLAIVPLIAVQAFTLNQSSTEARKQVFDQLQSIGKLKFNQIQQWLGDDHQILRTMIDPNTAVTFAQLIALPSDEIQSTVGEQLASVVQRTSQAGLFDKFIIYDIKGNIVAASTSGDVGKIVNQQPYFQTSLTDAYTQPPYYDRETGKLTAVQTQPLLSINGDKTIGVLAGILDIPRLGEIMTEFSGLGQTGETYLVSKANNHLVTPSRFAGYSTDQAYHSQGIDNALAGQSGSSLYRDFRGVSVLGYYQWIPELQLGLVSEQAESEALAASQNVFDNSLLILLAASIIAIVIGVLIITQITRPLGKLTDIASQIAAGNLNLRAGIEQRNEVGRLGDAFDLMTTQLTDSIGTLEQRVKERTQALEVAREQAEQANRAKSTFLSNMSHELRTPLNVVIGYSCTMLEMPTIYANVPLPAQYVKDVKLIRESGYYLLGLINDILDLSKIEAGKLELHCESVAIPDLFSGILSTCVGLVKDKPIQIRTDIDDVSLVWADPIRVRQIILNLMSNAIKFTQTGSVTLHARGEGQTVRISVSDTGIGIPETALSHIFDRFEQATHDTDKQYGGTGLGLDITRRLVQMHQGEITVESVVGQGSTFTFMLPISTEEVAEAADLSESIASSAKMLKPVPTAEVQGVLLIEDEGSLRELMHRTLEGAGYIVVDEQDGAQAMAVAKGLLPDLIILDICLPNVSGWELLKSLMQNPNTASIPVLICTVSEDEERASELGASLYLRKPFSPEELLANVQQLLPFYAQPDGDN